MVQTREAVIAAAEKYIRQGLVEHKPDQVPFADDVVRTELGMVTGSGADELRELLRSDVYLAVQGVDNLRWIVEGEQAVVFYEQRVSFTDVPLLICTRFRVVEGLIREIEILLYGKGMTDGIAESVAQLASA